MGLSTEKILLAAADMACKFTLRQRSDNAPTTLRQRSDIWTLVQDMVI